jgi:hypothetical protein
MKEIEEQKVGSSALKPVQSSNQGLEGREESTHVSVVVELVPLRPRQISVLPGRVPDEPDVLYERTRAKVPHLDTRPEDDVSDDEARRNALPRDGDDDTGKGGRLGLCGGGVGLDGDDGAGHDSVRVAFGEEVVEGGGVARHAEGVVDVLHDGGTAGGALVRDRLGKGRDEGDDDGAGEGIGDLLSIPV